MSIKCIHCGKEIKGTCYIDWRGSRVCNACHTKVKTCVSCFGYCDSNAKEVDNGKVLCTHCQKYYMQKEDCQYVVGFINDIYERSGLGRVKKWDLVVVDYEAMVYRSGSEHVRGLAHRCGNETIIYMYRFLSRVAFAKTLSHEMLHIWQYERGIDPEDKLCEGFCNLGAYVVLKEIGNQEANKMIEWMEANRDPVYGEGFRIMKRAYEAGGWPAAIKKLTS